MGSVKMGHSSRDQALIGPYRVEVCSPGSSSDSRKSGVLIRTLLCSTLGESSSGIPEVCLLSAGGGESIFALDFSFGSFIFRVICNDMTYLWMLKGAHSLFVQTGKFNVGSQRVP